MKNILRLVLFELRQTSISAILFFVLMVAGIWGYFLILAEFENLLLLDLFILLTVVIGSSSLHFSGKGFMFSELDGLYTSAFYRYMKRMPVDERHLFRSRIVIKFLNVTVLMIVGIIVVIGYDTNEFGNFPFSFNDAGFYAFLCVWVSIAHISITTALNDIGINTKEDPHLVKKSWYWILGSAVFYAVVQLIIFFMTGNVKSFMQFSIEVSHTHASIVIICAVVLSLVSIIGTDLFGMKKIEKQKNEEGVGNANDV